MITQQIVISIKPQWSELIRSGRKTIELRKRFPIYNTGKIAFLYESSPNKCITAIMQLGFIHNLPTDVLWNKFHQRACVRKILFDAYFQGKTFGTGIEITQVRQLDRVWLLKELRQQFSFSPPQSWAYARNELVAKIGGVQ